MSESSHAVGPRKEGRRRGYDIPVEFVGEANDVIGSQCAVLIGGPAEKLVDSHPAVTSSVDGVEHDVLSSSLKRLQRVASNQRLIGWSFAAACSQRVRR